jgi:hypothetical protein
MADGIVDHDVDYFAWTQEQAKILRNLGGLIFELPLDARNLADEVEGLGIAERQRLQEALEAVVVHVIKLENSAARAPRKDWHNTVAVERRRAQRVLRASPSLFYVIDVEELFQSARLLAASDMSREGGFDGALPAHMPYTMAQLLNSTFWPVNRHGLGE